MGTAAVLVADDGGQDQMMVMKMERTRRKLRGIRR